MISGAARVCASAVGGLLGGFIGSSLLRPVSLPNESVRQIPATVSTDTVHRIAVIGISAFAILSMLSKQQRGVVKDILQVLILGRFEETKAKPRESQDKEHIQRSEKCIVCWDRSADHMIEGCFHLCVCRNCKPGIARLGKCPICNYRLKPGDKIRKVYRSGTRM